MLRIAICDDNELQLSITMTMVSAYLNSRGITAKTECFQSGAELLAGAESDPFDIYMLDLIMPEMTGMEAAEVLRKKNDKGQIIFLTVSLDYAAASYEVDALYYMLKPLDRDILYKVLDKAIKKVASMNLDFQVKTSEGYALIKPKELIYIEAQGRNPVYHQTRGRTVKGLVLRSSFSAATKGLLTTGYFAYLGPSKMINLKYVEKMDDESVLLSDGSLIYGSKAACSAFHIAWETYLVEMTKKIL